MSAEVGSAAGGIFNVFSRRGTNKFHDSVFENWQNDYLNARNVFVAVQPTVRFNQFGGSAGGPVLKDKLFFYVYPFARLLKAGGLVKEIGGTWQLGRILRAQSGNMPNVTQSNAREARRPESTGIDPYLPHPPSMGCTSTGRPTLPYPSAPPPGE